MSDGRRQYDLDRIEAQRARETEDWLARMKAEMAAEEAAKAPEEDNRITAEWAKAAATGKPPACCRSFDLYRYHDAYCSKNFSRSAGS